MSADYTEREWLAKVAACGWRCIFCGRPVHQKPLHPDAELTKEHLVPLVRGGVDILENIAPACLACNRLKAKQTADEFLAERLAFSTPVELKTLRSTCTAFSKTKPLAIERTPLWISHFSERFSMEAKINYAGRREFLRHQAAEILRLRQVEAGQMTLPIFGDGTAKKLAETEAATLPFHGMDVSRRKA